MVWDHNWKLQAQNNPLAPNRRRGFVQFYSTEAFGATSKACLSFREGSFGMLRLERILFLYFSRYLSNQTHRTFPSTSRSQQSTTVSRRQLLKNVFILEYLYTGEFWRTTGLGINVPKYAGEGHHRSRKASATKPAPVRVVAHQNAHR